MKKTASIFKALSDETRLKIVYILLKGELCVCELVDIMQDSQPKISRHLSILKNAQIVIDRRDAQMIFYSINRENEYMLSFENCLNKILALEVEESLLVRLEKTLSHRRNGKCCPDGYYPNCC